MIISLKKWKKVSTSNLKSFWWFRRYRSNQTLWRWMD